MYIAIEGESVESCRLFLEEYSNDVRYHKSKPKVKSQRGKRVTPVGIIVAANMLESDKVTTFGKHKRINADADRRCIVWD